MNAVLRLSIYVFVGMFFVHTLQAATIIVDSNGSADYTTIQDAIDNADDNDEIIVQQGIYYEAIDLEGKAVTLRSANPNDMGVVVNTIIDANEADTTITCNSGEEPNTIIQGFIITGGAAFNGGGMYCDNASPTVTNCTFADNWADNNGGGIYCYDSNAAITDCLFNGNEALLNGGGMYSLNGRPLLTNCTFIDNEAVDRFSNGGGMCCLHSSAAIKNCTFANNWGTKGAGIACIDSSPTLTNCMFISNIAECECMSGSNIGGGVYCQDNSNPTLINCTLIDNEAGNDGGGMYFDDTSIPQLTGTVACRNNDPDEPNQIFGSFTDNGGNIIGKFCPPVKTLGDLDDNRIEDFVEFANYADNWLESVNP